MRNAGNLRLTASGEAGAAGPFGVGLGDPVHKDVPEMLPGTVYEYTHTIPDIYPLFWINGEVTLTPQAAPQSAQTPDLHPVTRGDSVIAIPWLPALAAILLTAVLIWRRRHAKRRFQAAVAAAVAEARKQDAAHQGHRRPLPPRHRPTPPPTPRSNSPTPPHTRADPPTSRPNPRSPAHDPTPSDAAPCRRVPAVRHHPSGRATRRPGVHP